MLRSFDPRSGAHAPDVEDPYYGTHDDFEDVFTVIDAALPGLHDWVDEQLERVHEAATVPVAAGLDRPGPAVVAFAYLCFTVLAPWQLGKNTTTSRENHQISSSLTAAPIPVTSVLPQQDSSAPDAQWRRVTATGHYLPDAQVLARLRVVEGEPAFEVLVPFVVDDGPTVLVDRGYVRPERGRGFPPIAPPPTGTVTVTAPAARLRDRPAG